MIIGHMYLVNKEPLMISIKGNYEHIWTLVVHPIFDDKLLKFLQSYDFEIGTNITEEITKRERIKLIIKSLLNEKQKKAKENLKNTKIVLKSKSKIGSPTTKRVEIYPVNNQVSLYNEEGQRIAMIIDREERKSGRTTRQADAYIQELFTVGEITVLDHAAPIGIAQRSLINILIGRLKNEHPVVKYELNRDKGTIKLIKNMKRTIQH